MLTIKTSFKNILGAGKRTWLNVAVLSFTFIILVLYNALVGGSFSKAYRDTQAWETGAGQFWHPQYDRLDVFTLQDAHGEITDGMQSYINEGTLTPVLVTQGVIYPQGRMQNVLLNGIDPQQRILSFPSEMLMENEEEIPAIIGTRMAKSADLREGDRIMMRWRVKNGVFDAQEIRIAAIFDTNALGVDNGQIWLSINDLQRITLLTGEASYFVKSADCPLQADTDGWIFKNLKFLLADLDALWKAGNAETIIIHIILLSIALLAVFDTQMLSIFRRQKEIGTYIALGMTPRKVMSLFTLEGVNYSLLAIVAGAIWGSPFLWLLAEYGYKMPGTVKDDMGIAVGDRLYPTYEFSPIATSIVIIILLSALISYLPTRKIAKQSVVNALKGKIE
jgi:ABC-type lipoprotein release transport system permease subunit